MSDQQAAARWVRVASVGDVPEGEVVGVKAEGEHVALYNVDGKIYATHDICTHAHAYLSEGYLEGSAIECPLHQAQYDVTSGKLLSGPSCPDVKTFPVRVQGHDVEVGLG